MITLASSSPRRRRLMEWAGVPFVAKSPEVDEAPLQDESVTDLVLRLAYVKASAVEGRVVVAADTMVVDGAGVVLGKPRDMGEARAYMARLNGVRHTVITGWAVSRDGVVQHRGVARTVIHLRALSPHEVDLYLSKADPLDKAGGFSIEGRGIALVREIDGCSTNALGLPLPAILPLIV